MTSSSRAYKRSLEPHDKGSAVGLYPHNMHPGLVPGISVEDQRNRFDLDKSLFSITAVLVVAFIIWGITMPDNLAAASSTAFNWAITNTGWLLNITMLLATVTMAYIGFSRLGRIKLGTDTEKPEFSYFSWVAMMFGAGIGVGIFFYGPSEPLSHYLIPPPHTVDNGSSVEALHQAMAQSHFHWGISPWAAYALVGAAIAYSSYRRGRVPLISSIFQPLFGSRATDGPLGKLIDVMALIATLFGTAATLGLSAIQIGQGVSIIRGAGPMTNSALIIVIAVLGCAFIISAVFFVTSADSASVVMGTMSSKGDPTPNKLIVIFWGLCMMGIAIVMLLTGGEDVLTGLQNLTILAALPFCLVLLTMMVAFIKDLRSDPMFIRRTYARSAMDNAVMRGIAEHGDEFEFSVQHAEDGRGAGHDFDSAADRYTEWYQRTDEEGENVDYDFETGEWSDGYDPEEEK